MKSSGGKGYAYWDCDTGELVQLRRIERFTLEMNMISDTNAEDDEIPEGLTVAQKLNNSVSLDLLEEGEPAFPVETPPASQTAFDSL